LKITDKYGHQLTRAEVKEYLGINHSEGQAVESYIDSMPLGNDPSTLYERIEEKANRILARLLEKGLVRFEHRQIKRKEIINSLLGN
jgi:hypothetical protein